ERQGDARPEHGEDQRAEDRVEEAAGFRLVEVRQRVLGQQPDVPLAEPLEEHVDDDRRGDRAEREPGRPRERETEAVAQRPACRRLPRPGHGRTPYLRRRWRTYQEEKDRKTLD